MPPASQLTFFDDEVAAPYAVTGMMTVADPGAVDLQIIIDLDEESGSCYQLVARGATVELYEVVGQSHKPLGHPGTINWRTGQETSFTLRRDLWQIAFLYAGRVIVRGYDSELHGSRAGYLAQGCQLSESFVQVLGEMDMTDDFMRPPSERGPWEPVRGSWQLRGLRVDPLASRMEADKSANAFSYFAKGSDERALSIAGSWYWEGYLVEAAVRAVHGGAIGLVGYYQDEDNYVGVRWLPNGSALGSGELQVIEVVDGHERVLATAPGGYLHSQWYQMRMGVKAGLVCVWIDDQLRLTGKTTAFGQGKVGLLAEGNSGILFDDVVVRPWQVIWEDFAEDVPGKWNLLSGNWTISAPGAARVTSPSELIAVAGAQEWDDYRHQVQVSAASGAVGLVFGYHSPADYYLLRWAPSGSRVPYGGKAQIVHVVNGQPDVLAEAALGRAQAGQAAVTVQRGLVRGWLGGKCVVQTLEPELRGGAVGLYAEQASGASFASVYAQELPPPRTVHVVKEFADTGEHAEMAEWSSPAGIWVAPEERDAPEAQWQSKGVYFGGKEVRFTLHKVGSRTGTLRLTLDADPGSNVPGYTLSIAATSGSNTLTVALLAGERSLGQKSVEVAGKSCGVQFAHQGDYLIATIGDERIFCEKVE